MFAYNWATARQVSYSGCPDGFYIDESRCKTQFEVQDQAMASCEENLKCSGVATIDYMFVPIESIFESDETKEAGNGFVIQKLNKIIQTNLDERTAGNMLVEHWEKTIEGELKDCTLTLYGKCIPEFDNMFEAKYYCEGLGDNCSGITQEINGNYTTRRGEEIINSSNKQSWMKANWCSNYTPPLNMKLPTIFNNGNNVKLMWPVVVFNDIGNDMKRSENINLNIVGSTAAMTHNQYKTLGLKLEINADTIVFDGDITLFNLQQITIKVRKVIIRKISKVSLKQATSKPDWTSSIAPIGYDGKHGVDGFPGTILNIEAGCVVGERDLLSFDIVSGSGSDGQDGSNGLNGNDGVDAPNSEKMMWYGTRHQVCGTFTSERFKISKINK